MSFRSLPLLTQVIIAGMHIELVGVLELCMPSSLPQEFWAPSTLCKSSQGAVAQEMSVRIDASLAFESLEEIIDIRIFQGLS